MKKIGFIGVGSMGTAMAMRLVEADYALTVCGRRDEAFRPPLVVVMSTVLPQTTQELAETGRISCPFLDQIVGALQRSSCNEVKEQWHALL